MANLHQGADVRMPGTPVQLLLGEGSHNFTIS